MGAIPLVLLGLALTSYLRAQIRDDALGEASHMAEVIARLEIQPKLSPAEFREGLSLRKVRAIDEVLRTDFMSQSVARVKVWSREGRVIYSDDRAILGRAFSVSPELLEALGGEVESAITDPERKPESAGDSGKGKLLEVYVPLRFSPGTPPAGAFELYLPYHPVAKQINDRTKEVSLLLLVGLALLYAALLRIVVAASKKLREQAASLRRQAAENEYQALHDALTGLPNRTLFHDRLEQATLAAKRANSQVAVLLMDLDRFKEINDTLGHHNGDLLLKQVGPRLRQALRASDTIARLGGDEFAVLVAAIPNELAAIGVADKISAALDQPFALPGLTVNSSASIGIALYPEHGEDVDTLLQRADVAMYEAKRTHRSYGVYAAELDPYSPSRLALVSDLRRAIDASELGLHYQPKIDLRSGEVKGVEALVRWQHPGGDLLSASELIGLAEHTGLIRPLALYVLDAALAQCSAWHEAGLDLSVAVNLSVTNLVDPELPDDVAGLLEKRDVAPGKLELEITESTVMADPVRARNVLARLRSMGVVLAIDDFGTGHSSLAYLKRLPVQELKVDKSFVINMDGDDDDAVIMRATIDLGRNLGLRVVAEGVESEEAARKLAALGCDLAQGHYYSPPVPPAQLTAFVEGRVSTRRARPVAI